VENARFKHAKQRTEAAEKLEKQGISAERFIETQAMNVEQAGIYVTDIKPLFL
jgi:hypothetical protein